MHGAHASTEAGSQGYITGHKNTKQGAPERYRGRAGAS